MTEAANLQGDPRRLERFRRRFGAGDVLFRAGEPATEAYLLEEGRIRVIHRVGTQERGLRVVRAGELFGEFGLVPGAERTATAIAILESTALVLDPTAFEEVILENPGLSYRLVQQVSRRLRDAEHQIETLMLRDAQLKVVVALIQLAASLPFSPSGQTIRIAVSPLELSARVGLDVETVRRNVQQLRTAGYLTLEEERIEIPALDALRELRSLLEVKDTIAGPGAAAVGRQPGDSLRP